MTNLNQLDNEAQKIIAKYDEKRAATLPLLHLAQDNVGYVTPEVEAWVSKWTEVPIVRIRAVSTFYSMYHKEQPGKHHIRFCTGTSCMLAGHEKTLDYLKKKLNVQNGCKTTDGKFSLEEAECLCACEVAPMMQLGGKYYGNLDEKKIDEILGKL